MAIPRERRGVQQARTLETLQSDLQKFMSTGGNLKVAKEFNNVIGPAQFSVPLTQVRSIKNVKYRYLDRLIDRDM